MNFNPEHYAERLPASISPLTLMTAIAHCVSEEPGQYLGESLHRDVGQVTVEWLLDHGLIERTGKTTPDDPLGQRSFRRTDKLVAWVDHLCRQPLPVCRWVVE